MNLISDFEAHKRDEDFDREDAKHHRETCSPAGACYIPFVENVRGEQHYCDIHRPEPKAGDSYVCTGSTCYDADKPHTHRYAPVPEGKP